MPRSRPCRPRRAKRHATLQYGSYGIGKGGSRRPALLAWAVVGIPLAWGVWITLSKSLPLFR
jgi:hypothetical protein